MFKVQKKDGSQEEFDDNKLLSSVTNSGGSAEDAQQVLSEVKTWLPTAVVDGMVSSTDLRSKVLDALRTVSPEVAANFESYKKTV